MSISKTPKIYLRIDHDGTHRAMFVNPNTDLGQAPNEDNGGVNVLRVYRRTAPTESFALDQDVELPYATSGDQPTELTFTPDRPGEFQFAWAYVDDDATPTPIDIEGSFAPTFRYVYAKLSKLVTILTAQGSCGVDLSNAEMLELIDLASEEVEELTGQFFYPKYHLLQIPGDDMFDLEIPFPIIEIFEVRRKNQASNRTGDFVMTPDTYVVYNRHIATRNTYNPSYPTKIDGYLEAPGDGSGGVIGGTLDDRRDPKVSLILPNEYGRGSMHARSGDIFTPTRLQAYAQPWSGHPVGFRKGRMNVQVAGLFGFTGPNFGVPGPIANAVERLALRQSILTYGDPDDVERVLNAHKVTMDKTDLHLIQYQQNDPRVGAFTGDSYVDRIIASFSRQISGGNV